MKINEIFFSIQGESCLAGWPTVFIRTSGCHLRCTYCDTKYAYHEGEKLSQERILDQVKVYSARHVCVTGGEPLLQAEVLPLMSSLCDLGYIVSCETSGDISCAKVDPRVHLVIDIKTPDSGAPDRFASENLKLENRSIDYKFVICSESDFAWANDFATRNNLFEKFNVLFSPSFTQIEPRWLAEKILAAKSPARLQMQLHKYIWSAETRGV